MVYQCPGFIDYPMRWMINLSLQALMCKQWEPGLRLEHAIYSHAYFLITISISVITNICVCACHVNVYPSTHTMMSMTFHHTTPFLSHTLTASSPARLMESRRGHTAASTGPVSNALPNLRPTCTALGLGTPSCQIMVNWLFFLKSHLLLKHGSIMQKEVAMNKSPVFAHI